MGLRSVVAFYVPEHFSLTNLTGRVKKSLLNFILRLYRVRPKPTKEGLTQEPRAMYDIYLIMKRKF